VLLVLFKKILQLAKSQARGSFKKFFAHFAGVNEVCPRTAERLAFGQLQGSFKKFFGHFFLKSAVQCIKTYDHFIHNTAIIWI